MTEKMRGPASQALLDVVNETHGYITIKDTIIEAARRTGIYRSDRWWWSRLMALALEGHIEASVYRDGDMVTFGFRRRRRAEGR